jgi:membrane-associated phospholipid phosphatase
VGQLWPERKLLVSVLLYGTAGLTGISRVYNNAHWASDVAVGAGIGAFTGWKVVRYSYDHPGNTIDRIFLGRRPRGTGANSAVRSPIFAASSDGWVPDRATGVPITFTIHTR